MPEGRTVQRFDVNPIGKLTKTPTGGARIPANIARTGLQTYFDERGNKIVEYRSPDEVFSQKTLDSIALAAVTVGHQGLITPENFKTHSVGMASEKAPGRVKIDGVADEFVSQDLIVNDGPTLRRVDTGDLCETSAGYTAKVIMRPGTTPDGQHYDAIQTDIEFNHIALLKKGCARAGGHARLRL